jgi:small redox-active disulfide protein 2
MMKIEILGTGCPKCKKTEKIVRETLKEQGIDAEIVKIEDLNDIIDRGVMMTPAVVVNGNVKIVGRVPTKDEIVHMLK